MKNRSTLTNLAEFIQSASEVLDEGDQLDVVYLDIAKAFDLVPHQLLLRKCQKYGLSDDVCKLIKSYLSNRAYQVTLNGRSSRRVFPGSGVGQGSVLGPKLFLLHFNDLLAELRCDGWCFADDLRNAKIIRSLEDLQLLQADIDTISKWCEVNGHELAVGKSLAMSITRKKQPLMAHYTVNGFEVKKTCVARDLGIMIDSNLRFDAQVDAVVKKAARLMGFVMRCVKNFHLLEPILALFNQIVRPVLEYCTPAWNPSYSTYIDRIEAIQHSFTRFIYKEFRFLYFILWPLFNNHFDKFALKCVLQINLNSVVSRHFCF